MTFLLSHPPQSIILVTAARHPRHRSRLIRLAYILGFLVLFALLASCSFLLLSTLQARQGRAGSVAWYAVVERSEWAVAVVVLVGAVTVGVVLVE